LKDTLQKLFYFLAGLIGGGVALIVAMVLEIILSILGKPTLSLAKNPFFLIALLLTAVLEELAKSAIARRLFNQYDDLWTIIGVGIGFGLAETYLAQSAIKLQFYSFLLPAVHLVFLLGGYLIVRRYFKEKKWFYFQWLLAATLLHWGYNVSQVLFLLKT
jgi:hypothetical protein